MLALLPAALLAGSSMLENAISEAAKKDDAAAISEIQALFAQGNGHPGAECRYTLLDYPSRPRAAARVFLKPIARRNHVFT